MKHSLKQNTVRSKSAGFIHINFRTQVPKTARQSISRQNNHTDLFSGMYNGKNISEQNESKLIIYKGVSMPIDQIVKLKTKTQQRTSKTVEQLLEQNIQLKNEINKLKQQISIIKAQMSVNYKRKSEHDLGKQMEIQFYKDVYWTNNEKSFRIVGMRQQYQKLKKQYNKQAKQLEQAKVKLIKKGITQAQVYISELQLQNKKYKSMLQQQNGKINKNKSRTPFKSTRSNKEQEMKNSLQQELLAIKQKLKQKDGKITFLEKVIINKDNRQHSMNKRARKIQKQNDILVNSHNNLLDQLEHMKMREQIQNIKYKSYYSQQISQLKREFKKQLNEKDKRIKELQQSHKKLQSGNRNNSMNQSGGISFSVINSRANRKLSLDYGNKDLTPLKQEKQTTPAKRYVSDHKQQAQHRLQQNISEIHIKMETREPKRADKKHSDKGIKMRRVQFSQVQHLGELLRYRMIGFRISPNQIKDEFIRKKVFTQQSNRSRSENQISIITKQVQTNSELEWQDQYISMKQIITIVMKQPFNLDTKQSVLLARYLIEDSDNEYVYCDQINENKRQIVKSIIKSLIGPYQLTSQADIGGYTEVMSRFSINLRTTLSTYYPEGTLPKQKLLQIVKGIGVELNAKQRQLLIGKASIKSLNLNQLRYTALFE